MFSIGEGFSTHVVVHILPTNVKQSTGEVGGGHREPVVQRPQSSAETIRNTRQSTTCRCVRLEHDKGFPKSACEVAGVDIRAHQVQAGVMVEEGGESLLRINIGTDIEAREAIVARVAVLMVSGYNNSRRG